MSSGFKTNNFDLLRILAALQVLLIHAYWHLEIPHPYWWPLIEAFPGVSVFFVISGFLISASLEKSPSFRSYLKNRALRIYPGLWSCVLFTVLIFSFFGVSFFNTQTALWLPTQLVGAIYTPSFLEGFGFGSYNGSLWTIPIELQFYVLLPALYWLANKTPNRDRTIVAAWTTFLIIALLLTPFLALTPTPENESPINKLLRYSFVPHFYLFLTGVILQRSKAYEHWSIAGKGLLWTALYLILWRLLPFSGAYRVALLMLLGVVVVSLAYTTPRISERILRGNDLSYGVYIYHGLLLNIFVTLNWTGSVMYVYALIVCTFFAAMLSWLLIEKPFLRKKKSQPTSATLNIVEAK